MDVETIRQAVINHPNIQALSKLSGVSAQCLYLFKRGERHKPKDSTLRMIQRALESNYRPKNRPKYTPRTERLIDVIRSSSAVDSDLGAINAIIEAAHEINSSK